MNFKDCIMENENEYRLYIPDSYDENTVIINYTHGGPSSIDNFNADTEPLVKYLEKNKPDCFVIMPKPNDNIKRTFDEYGQWDIQSSQKYAEVTNRITDEVAKNYGLNKNNVIQDGFSWGGTGAIRTLVDNLKNNPNLPSQTIIMNDAATYKQLTTEEIQLLKNNNTLFIYFDKLGDTSDQNITQYAKEGIPVIRAIENTYSHPEVNKMTFEQGIIDYVIGNNSLSGENCSFQYFDSKENKWKEMPPELLNNIDDVYKFYGIEKKEHSYTYTATEEYKITSDFKDLNVLKNNLKEISNIKPISSDLDYLVSSINKIRSSIKTSNILNLQTNPSIGSTTQVPAKAIDILYQYASSVISLMDKLSRETTSIANIGIVIDNQDKDLEQETEEIIDTQPTEEPNHSEATTPIPVVPPVSTSIKDDVETKPEKPITTEPPKKEENNTPPTKPSITPSNNQAVSKPNETPSNQQTSSSNNSNIQNQNNNNNQSTINETQAASNTDFPKYEEIYSNDNQIVYNYNDECKLIIHHEGDQITGIEYYYDLGSKENAFNMFDEINNKYSGMEGFKEVIQNDRYIKVVLNNDYVNKFNINDIKNKFSNLEEITK